MISKSKEIKKYCSEPLGHIENYDKAVTDKEHLWHCHHRGELLPCGVYSVETLKKFGLYWNRPASELIFLTGEEHLRLHHKGNKYRLGVKLSYETKMKMSESRKGIKNMLGKHHSEKTRRKMSESMKGNKNCLGRKLSDETRRKMSESRKRYFERRGKK